MVEAEGFRAVYRPWGLINHSLNRRIDPYYIHYHNQS
jgi:hypothetical protein